MVHFFYKELVNNDHCSQQKCRDRCLPASGHNTFISWWIHSLLLCFCLQTHYWISVVHSFTLTSLGVNSTITQHEQSFSRTRIFSWGCITAFLCWGTLDSTLHYVLGPFETVKSSPKKKKKSEKCGTKCVHPANSQKSSELLKKNRLYIITIHRQIHGALNL